VQGEAMTANALQLPYRQMMPAMDDQASRLFRIGDVVYFESAPRLDLVEECSQDEGKRTQPYAFVFLLAMAAISLVCEVGGGLIGDALLTWFGVPLDPFVLSGALHSVATLVGVGVARCFSKVTPGSAAKRHMLVTLVAAMGIGLILVWLSRLAGYTNALDWPLVLVYLLWAWVAAVSAA
jgi:hypothetical protein